MAEQQIITLNSAKDFQEKVMELVLQAQKRLTIFTPNLEPELYDNNAFVDATLQLMKRSRHTEIRILALETKHLVEGGHRLLKLLRYTDQQFQLKKTGGDPTSKIAAYFICDDHSIIRRQDAGVYQGLCYTEDRARVKNQQDEFDLLWAKAIPDADLRQLTI